MIDWPTMSCFHETMPPRARRVLLMADATQRFRRGEHDTVQHVYAEVLGFGQTNDAHHMTAPRPDGSQAARAMRLALADAQLAAGELEYVNAHASSTPLNDPTETQAIRQVLGERAATVPVSGTKGYYGHALGASGAIEAAICALALQREWLPPTVNLDAPDDACALAHVAPEGARARVEHLISNSFGFGGINAALVMRRWR